MNPTLLNLESLGIMEKPDVACVIDDDPIYIFGVKKVMKIIDFCNKIMVFKNGEEALIKLTELIENVDELPDIILLDLNMPILDGWQFLDEFIKLPCKKKITIYIASSSVDPQDLLKAKTYDVVQNYVIKPISIEKMKKVLEEFKQAG